MAIIEAAAHVGQEGRPRHLGGIHQPDVVAAAAGRHLQLLLPLQQGLVDLAVALRLALEHRVADVLAAQIDTAAPF